MSLATASDRAGKNCESGRQIKETAGNLSRESTGALTGGTLVSGGISECDEAWKYLISQMIANISLLNFIINLYL